MISGEEDNRILEYNMDGVRTLREAELPPRFRNLPFNLGLEALSYNHITHTLWTCNESDTIYLQSFDDSLKPLCTYRYLLAQPRYDRTKARNYAHGIGTICALDDQQLAAARARALRHPLETRLIGHLQALPHCAWRHRQRTSGGVEDRYWSLQSQLCQL